MAPLKKHKSDSQTLVNPDTYEVKRKTPDDGSSWINDSKKRKLSIKCPICDNNFSEKGSLTRHIGSVHEGKKPFKCSICDYKFKTKWNLSKHIASVHELSLIHI